MFSSWKTQDVSVKTLKGKRDRPPFKTPILKPKKLSTKLLAFDTDMAHNNQTNCMDQSMGRVSLV